MATIANKIKSDIRLEMSGEGIERVQIIADDDEQQAAGHHLLERITPALRSLDVALRLAGLEE